MADRNDTSSSAGGVSRSAPPTVVVDLGTVRTSRIDERRSGSGRPNDCVAAIMADLREQGTIGDAAPPVVFIVGEKWKRWLGLSMC